MAFQLKDFASITASMINWMRSVQKIVTDFNIGAVVRSMLEACAAELDELYKQVFIGLKEAIPVSVYTSFNFPPLAATPAGGQITLTFTAQGSDEVIAAGTLWSPSTGGSVNYTQTANVTLLAGHTSVNVPVSAVTAGTVGNLPAAATFNPNPVPTGFVSATNVIAFINGTNTETPDQQKVRFNAFISTLSRGTVAAIQYGCTTTTLVDSGGNVTERVASAQVIEPWKTDPSQPVSLVNAYIYNGVGGTSPALVTQCQKVIDGYYDISGNAIPGWKAAGVKAVVAAVTETAINVAGVLTAFPGFDKPTLIAQATPAIFAYLQGLQPGAGFIYVDMTTAVKNITGVANFVPSTPTADIAGIVGVKYTPGTIVLT
jgi:hypothetical protein